jgi:hypothetical protein
MIIFFRDFPSSALDRGHTNIEVELFDVIRLGALAKIPQGLSNALRDIWRGPTADSVLISTLF